MPSRAFRSRPLAAAWLAGALLAWPASARGAAAPAAAPRVPDLAGRAVDPFAGEARATVLLFTRTDCPISNRYAPTVRRLHERFAPLGIAFRLIYPDPRESAEAIRAHRDEHGLPLLALRDPRYELVALAGARVTPEAAVFVRGRLLYRGRIDDRFVDLEQRRPEPTTRDLEVVLEALVEGRTVLPSTTEAVGCFLPALP